MSNIEQPLEDWQITGLIYKVSEELQGFKQPDSAAQEIIDLISNLRTQGKLNKQQLKILDNIGWIKSIDFEEF